MFEISVYSENIYPDWKFDEQQYLDIAKKILNFYLCDEEIFNKSCLFGHDFSEISFDILYCDGVKTHEINCDYRDKDYVADIITFAIFADTDDKFVLDGEVNLGEIVFALDKIEQEAIKKNKTREDELIFLISHGILHLLGFDHQSEEDYNFIIELQDKAIKAL
ncbi:MAG: rRNA maturation RNase YbeY [Candidatus Gastranaerophilales bacterium]